MHDRASLHIRAEGVQKRFTRRPIFRPVSFQAASGDILAITGHNGAGKSTLLKIIGDVLSPSNGTCAWGLGDDVLDHDGVRTRLGYVAPYLELYDELTAPEHIMLVAELKGIPFTVSSALEMLDGFGLDPNISRSQRHLRAYSSGMKQRVRCAMAFACQPAVLLLDEPTSNLDEAGTEIVLTRARAAAAEGAIVVIATNDPRERAIARREIAIEAV